MWALQSNRLWVELFWHIQHRMYWDRPPVYGAFPLHSFAKAKKYFAKFQLSILATSVGAPTEGCFWAWAVIFIIVKEMDMQNIVLLDISIRFRVFSLSACCVVWSHDPVCHLQAKDFVITLLYRHKNHLLRAFLQYSRGFLINKCLHCQSLQY